MRFNHSISAITTVLVFACVLSIFAPPAVLARTTSDTSALLEAYFTYLLLEYSVQHTSELNGIVTENDQQQIEQSNKQWLASALQNLRNKLSRSVPGNSKEAFGLFVADYTVAEKANDQQYLASLAAELEISVPPTSYTAFNNDFTSNHLKQEINDCAQYISEVQTWLDVKTRTPDAPNLRQWLSKDSISEPELEKKPSAPFNPLAAAEAPLPEFKAETDKDPGSPMDAFSSMRDKRRERDLRQAQAGMKQVAAEREAAEAAYAGKKATAAKAEADAVAIQARKLATAEQDALSQRQNSWSARLKKIVSGTIGGTVSAFTGGIGAEAGARAADAVFN